MKDVRITFTTNEPMAEKLKSTAAKQDVSVSKIIRDAVNLYFQKEDK
jgi:hypothetical protein